jgi:ATP-dependent RNA helicase DeaD
VRRKRPADAPSAPTTTPVGGVHTSRIWMGVGKKDEATVGDIVAVLAREVGLDRSLIGRVDLRDAFTLVEVPSSEAERVALKLVGLTVRKRKLSARVDRGPSGPSGPSRGGGGGGFGGARSGGGAGAGGGRPPFKPRG